MKKVVEGRPHVVDHLINDEVSLIVNTRLGGKSCKDDMDVRTAALKFGIPCVTTISEGLRKSLPQVTALQDLAARPAGRCIFGV